MQLSLLIQFVTGLINILGLTITLPEQHKLLTSILKWETVVQFIELVFYLLMTQSYNLATLAATRYYDWVLTTPVMLVTVAAYFKYEEEQKQKDKSTQTLSQFINDNKGPLIRLVIYNFLMLIAGYLGERGMMNLALSNAIGFGFFFATFYELKKFSTTNYTNTFFYIMSFIWGLYGVAAMLPIMDKNVTFNILDLISKNIFGLFVTYKIYQVSKN